MKRIFLILMLWSALGLSRTAHALSLSAVSLSNTTIPFERVGTPTGTTVQFTLDQQANVDVTIFRLQDVTDIPSASNQVATLSQTGMGAGVNTIFWNGLWLINGDLGRKNGN